ncbi:MAG: hypothetical protein HFK04_01820 [Oscillospiraceae bacterium]|nr:hypothetical protein [Oscillospiraceae bacterium]
MQSGSRKPMIRISVPFLCGLILFLLFDRTGLGGQMVLAALVHEIGHLIAMAALGEQPQSIIFGGFGIRMERRLGTRLPYQKEIWIYGAGPAANLLTALLFFSNPRICRVHLLLGLFNLLPMGVLDGGQILRCILQQKMEMVRGDFWRRSVSLCCGLLLILLAVAVFLTSGYNASLLSTSVYLMWLLIAGNDEV